MLFGGDLAFSAAKMLMLGRSWADAADLFMRSAKKAPHRATYYNLGICFYKGGAVTKAGALFEKALALDKNYIKAKKWRNKCAKQLALLDNANQQDATRRYFQHVSLPV